MRTLIPMAFFALVGCNATCDAPSTVFAGATYQVFSNVVDYDLQGSDTAPPGQSPINGYTDWQIQWGSSLEGPVTIIVDDQSFTAQGIWDDTECGNFYLTDWTGTYISSDGTEHEFSAVGRFQVWDVYLEGVLTWGEAWSAADGASGSFLVGEGGSSGIQYAAGG